VTPPKAVTYLERWLGRVPAVLVTVALVFAVLGLETRERLRELALVGPQAAAKA
jgi:hypothetical protein